MKTSQRIPKAIAVILVIGAGLLYNIKDKSIVIEHFREMTAEFETTRIKNDTIQTNESENRLFIYTKSIINTSIKHLISSL